MKDADFADLIWDLAWNIFDRAILAIEARVRNPVYSCCPNPFFGANGLASGQVQDAVLDEINR
jgi:hypothetical protein